MTFPTHRLVTCPLCHGSGFSFELGFRKPCSNCWGRGFVLAPLHPRDVIPRTRGQAVRS